MNIDKTSKKVVQGVIDIDYDDPALILNYEVEVVCLDDNGRTLVLERNPGNDNIIYSLILIITLPLLR
jgi:hypothetical protein